MLLGEFSKLQAAYTTMSTSGAQSNAPARPAGVDDAASKEFDILLQKMPNFALDKDKILKEMMDQDK